MNESAGKKQFDAIPIPQDLPRTVHGGLRRGKNMLLLRSASGALAGLLMVIFLAANVPVLYAQAAEIPILAPIVRMMHVGSGGSPATGVLGSAGSTGNNLTITFTDEDGRPVPVPVFSAARRKLPRRLTLRLHGMAETAALNLTEALQAQEAVSRAYALSASDPGEQGVIFHLNPGWDCAVLQSENRLSLAFSREDPEGPAPSGYVLSSPPMVPGPALAELTESLLWEGATQLQLSPRDYRVVLGEFSTPEQARKARESIIENKNIPLEILCISPEDPQWH